MRRLSTGRSSNIDCSAASRRFSSVARSRPNAAAFRPIGSTKVDWIEFVPRCLRDEPQIQERRQCASGSDRTANPPVDPLGIAKPEHAAPERRLHGPGEDRPFPALHALTRREPGPCAAM